MKIENLYNHLPRNFFMTPNVLAYAVIKNGQQIVELSDGSNLDHSGKIYEVSVLEINNGTRYGLSSVRDLSQMFTDWSEAKKYYNLLTY